MIVAAAFWPHPPLLLAEYASLVDPGAALRARCRGVLAELDSLDVQQWVILAGRNRQPEPISTRAPLGVRVARELLGQGRTPAEVLVPFDADAREVDRAAERVRALAEDLPTAVLVMGDGSARRGEKAPGHLDERSFALDDTVARALAAGDPAPLRDLDPVLVDELLVGGRAAWQSFAALARGRARVRSAWSGDPFGVMYHIALWTWA